MRLSILCTSIVLLSFLFIGCVATSGISKDSNASLTDKDRQNIINMFTKFYQAANERDSETMLAMYTQDATIQWYYQGKVQTVSYTKFIEDLDIIMEELKTYAYEYTGPKLPEVSESADRVTAKAVYDYKMTYNGKQFTGSFTDSYELVRIDGQWKVKSHLYK